MGWRFPGSDREAIAHGEEAIRLSPLDPDTAMFLGGIAVAHYLRRPICGSLPILGAVAAAAPGFHGAQRLRCASLAQIGRRGGAEIPRDVVRLEQPQLSLDWIKSSVPYQTPELMEHFLRECERRG